MSSKVPEFFARPERLEQLADEAWREGRQLDRLAQETRDVTDRLKMLTQMEQPLHQLARCCAAMREQAAALGRMSRTLDTVAGLYRHAEESAIQSGEGGVSPFSQAEFVIDPITYGPPSVPPGAWQQMLDTFRKLLREIPLLESTAFPVAECMTLVQVIGNMNTVLLSLTVAGVVERCGWWYGNEVAGQICATGVVPMLCRDIVRQMQS